MKVLIYSPFVLWLLPFGNSLEIARKHLDNGDIVNFLICDASLYACDTNNNHLQKNCLDCLNTAKNALDILRLAPENIFKLSIRDNHETVVFPEFRSVKELRSFMINDFDIGSGVASSLISYSREAMPDMRLYQGLINAMLRSSWGIYHSVLNHLNNLKPDILYIHNGRHASVRPALRAAQKAGVTVRSEDLASYDRYFFIENTYIQDLAKIKSEIELHWQNNQNLEDKIYNAELWFRQKASIKDSEWKSYIKMQQEGLLPENFSHDKTIITIFNSSEDEFEALDLWKETLFDRQNPAIRFILENLKNNNIHFYLRMHPNLKGILNSQLKEIYQMNYPNLTVIPPESKVSSYDLMRASDKVISFGSTIGIEAAYWNIPSVLLGRAYYEELDSCYKPQTKEQLINLLNQELKPLNRTGAIKYGYWEQTKGIGYQYFVSRKRSIFENQDFGAEMTKPEQLEESFREIKKYHYQYSDILLEWLNEPEIEYLEHLYKRNKHLELSQDNYKSWFRTLIDYQEICIYSENEIKKPIISVCIPLIEKSEVFNKILGQWFNFKDISPNFIEIIIMKNDNSEINQDYTDKVKIISGSFGDKRLISENFIKSAKGKIILLVNQFTIPIPQLLHMHINFHLKYYKTVDKAPGLFRYANLFSNNSLEIARAIISEKKINNHQTDFTEFFCKNYSILNN